MSEEIKTMEEQNETLNTEELKSAMEEKFAKFQSENMILGFRVAARYILGVIVEFENSSGKKSNNDYKRLVKKIKDFCNRGLITDDKSEENDESTENSESETIQN